MKSLAIEFSPSRRIRIGYRSPGLTDVCTPVQKMELARSLGMAVIEPQFAPREFPDWDAVDAYRAAADEAGIHVETAGIGIKVATTEALDDLDAQIDNALRFARMMRCPYVFNCVEYPPATTPQAETWELVVRNVRRCVERFAEAAVRFAVEPEWFVASVERMRRLHQRVDHDQLLLNFDPTNFYLAGSDPLEALDLFTGRIVSGHLKDGVYRTRDHRETPVGEGEMDYRRIFSALIERDLAIPLYIEHCNSPADVQQAAAHIARMIVGMRVDQHD